MTKVGSEISDLFQDCFFGSGTIAFGSPSEVSRDFATDVSLGAAAAAAAAVSNPTLVAFLSQHKPDSTTTNGTKRKASGLEDKVSLKLAQTSVGDKIPLNSEQKSSGVKGNGLSLEASVPEGGDLTKKQRTERRERNREHAKRSRLRKKFLLESLQDQISDLEEELEELRGIIRKELPRRSVELLAGAAAAAGGGGNGNGQTFKPLPMPSGFGGPMKTLMEPDNRLMAALSGSQQNFSVSDPSLPDNPIIYVSQGFLDLTGYRLDQVLGRNCRFLQGPGTDPGAVDMIRKGVNEGVDTSVCLLNYKADGTPFWNQFFVAALRDAENNVVNFVGVQCEVSKARVESELKNRKGVIVNEKTKKGNL